MTVTTSYIYNIYRKIVYYINILYKAILLYYKSIQRYLLFRSKYLYRVSRKIRISSKIDTKQVIDSLPSVNIGKDTTSYIEDDSYFEEIDKLNSSIRIGNKNIKISDIPKIYQLIDFGEKNDKKV